MSAGSRTDGEGSQVMTSLRVRTIVQSIKEIVRNHSDADIYAVLKESNMDPNETAQKLLNQDPFHEVKRRRDKKKELTGYRDFSDTRRRVEHNVQPARSRTTWDGNIRLRGYIRRPMIDAGVTREFRVVRDNRVKQNANNDVTLESSQNPASRIHTNSNALGKSNPGVVDRKQATLEGSVQSVTVNKPSDGPVYVEDMSSTGILVPPQLEKAKATPIIQNKQVRKDVKDNSKPQYSSGTNSIMGLYPSSSDPVHVPSPASKLAGTVGAIRRDVGVVGVRKQLLNHPLERSSVSSSFSVPLLGTDASSSPSFGHSIAVSEGIQLNEVVTTEPVVLSSRQSSGSQYSSKTYQQSAGQQKALVSTREWKPKPSQKVATDGSEMKGTPPTSASSFPDNSGSSKPDDATNLSEKLSQTNISEDRHVIIPHHLRVPESELTQLTFGSFGVGFDSSEGFSSVSRSYESAEQLRDGASHSTLASVPVGSSGNVSVDDQGDTSDNQVASSRAGSPASSAESDEQSPGNTESLNRQTVHGYPEIRSVETHTLPYISSHAQQHQTPTSLPHFSAYDSQTSYDIPYLRTVMDDNAQAQNVASSSPEAVNSHATNVSPGSTVMNQQQLTLQQQQQQQQALANMYPQLHISHFPNFMPYRQVYSPVFVPPMPLPNYSSNLGYAHPSNGNNYLLMPGGNTHVTGGIKYAPSQYKPVPAATPTAYGNFSNPTGFTISPPGSAGGVGSLDDASRMKYKDNNLYVANPQAEASDLWIQTPRELPSLQSPAPYYSLSGQPPNAAAPAFMPAPHAGHASFSAAAAAAAAAQSSHVQYPGLYHPPASPAAISGAHHLVHQSNIGGVGVGGAAPGPQVGGYQQPQLGHLNWPANF